MARAAVKRGLRLSVGSWNTIWMRLRQAERANCAAGIAPMSSPAKMMRPARLLDEAHDHHRGRRLAAAGFADEADALATPDGEADPVDGAEGLPPDRGPSPAGRGISSEHRPLAGRLYSLTRTLTTRSGVAGGSLPRQRAAVAASSGKRSRSVMPGAASPASGGGYRDAAARGRSPSQRRFRPPCLAP